MTQKTMHPVVLIAAVALLTAANMVPGQTKSVPAEARNHYLLAQDYLKQGEREKAVVELKAAIRLAPEFIEAHNDYIANQQAKPDQVVAEYEAYLKEHPRSAIHHFLAGKAYGKAGRGKEGEAEYQKALDLSPGFSWALIELGTAALDKDDNAKAADLFEKARAEAADSPKLHMTLASKLNSVKKYSSALAEVQRVLKLDPSSFDAYPTLWRTKLRLTWGSEQTQAEVMKEIVSLEKRYSSNPRALDAAARGYAIFFNDEQEDRVRRSILDIDPRYFVKSGTGMSTRAKTAAGNELVFAGPDVEKIDEVGWLADPKAKVAAYRQIETGIKDQDLKMHVLYAREASEYIRDSDFENAERLLRVMENGGARISPQQMELATALVSRGVRLDTARGLVEQNVAATRGELAKLEAAKSPTISGTKSLLAQWLYLQGRLLAMQGAPDQAINPLEESVRLYEGEPAAFELGKAYARLNRTDDAIRLLLMACSFNRSQKQEATEGLERIYGDREAVKPLAVAIDEAVEKRKASLGARASSYHDPAAAMKGKTAPAFSLSDATGRKVNLSDFQGKIILLNFWATW